MTPLFHFIFIFTPKPHNYFPKDSVCYALLEVIRRALSWNSEEVLFGFRKGLQGAISQNFFSIFILIMPMLLCHFPAQHPLFPFNFLSLYWNWRKCKKLLFATPSTFWNFQKAVNDFLFVLLATQVDLFFIFCQRIENSMVAYPWPKKEKHGCGMLV